MEGEKTPVWAKEMEDRLAQDIRDIRGAVLTRLSHLEAMPGTAKSGNQATS